VVLVSPKWGCGRGDLAIMSLLLVYEILQCLYTHSLAIHHQNTVSQNKVCYTVHSFISLWALIIMFACHWSHSIEDICHSKQQEHLKHNKHKWARILLYYTTFQLVSIMQFYVCIATSISSPGNSNLNIVLHRSETSEMAIWLSVGSFVVSLWHV